MLLKRLQTKTIILSRIPVPDLYIPTGKIHLSLRSSNFGGALYEALGIVLRENKTKKLKLSDENLVILKKYLNEVKEEMVNNMNNNGVYMLSELHPYAYYILYHEPIIDGKKLHMMERPPTTPFEDLNWYCKYPAVIEFFQKNKRTKKAVFLVHLLLERRVLFEKKFKKPSIKIDEMSIHNFGH